MTKSSKIYVAGHKGMVGSAIVRALKKKGYENILTAEKESLDLTDTKQVEDFFYLNKPEYVFLSAAKVGGIEANRRNPVGFLLDNLKIQNNVIEFSSKIAVKRLIFLGSSCIYPKDCPQPMKEEYLLTGPLEPTNEGYALAKIAGAKLAQFYNKQYDLNVLNVMPSNVYGTNDHFDPVNSHVLSALVKKFVDAVDENQDQVVIWGNGIAKREFLHVDDLARAILFLLREYESSEIINVGTGKDISIKDLAILVADLVEFKGNIFWDTTKPDGMLRKCLNVSKLNNLGFKPQIGFVDGIKMTIEEYVELKKKGKL